VTELDPPKAKKKRSKVKSPNALSLEECKRRGWPAMTVEQRIPHTFITRDLFNVIDIVAITPAGILGIQATSNSGGNHRARRHKIMAEPRMEQWTLVGGLLEIWSWSTRVVPGTGRRKVEFDLRAERIAWSDFEQAVRIVNERTAA
jgi:hypothetical protein